MLGSERYSMKNENIPSKRDRKVLAKIPRETQSTDPDVSASRILKFAGVGFIAAAIDYVVYEVCVLTFLSGFDFKQPLAIVIAGAISTIAAFFLHSNITWKECDPGKFGVIKFFIWNILIIEILRPQLTVLFDLEFFHNFYQFVYMLVSWIPLFSSYVFVSSTTSYVLITIITMTLNFIFYEKFVFGSKKQREKIDVKSIRKPREEKQAKSKTKDNGN